MRFELFEHHLRCMGVCEIVFKTGRKIAHANQTMQRMDTLKSSTLKRGLSTLLLKDQTQMRQPLFVYVNMISYGPTLVDLTNNFFVLWINVKVHLYNYSYIFGGA